MGFGEYQGMTEREVQIVILGKIQALTEKVDSLNFPCNERALVLSEHDNRLQRIEDDIRKVANKKADRILIWGLLISAIAGWGGLLLALITIINEG